MFVSYKELREPYTVPAGGSVSICNDCAAAGLMVKVDRGFSLLPTSGLVH